MDGTLVNSSLTIANAINHVRKNLGFEAMEQDHILKHVNEPGINPAQFFYHTEVFDTDHERWFSEYYSKNHKQELVLYDGIGELLIALKDRGYKLALATNAYRRSTIESLTHLNILDVFDGIACYDDVAQGKPHPDMLYKLLSELEHTVSQSLFIGDGPRDEQAAKHAQIDYLMVDWGFTEHDDKDVLLSVEELQNILVTIKKCNFK